MTTKKMGVAILMTMIVENTENSVKRNERMDRGIVSSITLMSLENRFKIRPRGVVSKKDIGERRMLFMSLLCSVLEAK